MIKDRNLNLVFLLALIFYTLDIWGVLSRGQASYWISFWSYQVQIFLSIFTNSDSAFYNFMMSLTPLHSPIFLVLSLFWCAFVLAIVRISPVVVAKCIGLALILGHGQSVLGIDTIGFITKNVIEFSGLCLLICTVLVYSLDLLKLKSAPKMH
ncbi:hypothetical protein MJH12_01270 [bacterium]|nr:hypothetical protein [bacterium]